MFEISEFDDYILATLKIKEGNLLQAEKFKGELYAIIEQHSKRVIVDFENVKYVDSSFLGALVSSLKFSMAKGSDIAVAHLNKDIYNLFQLIRMDKVFQIYKTLP